MELMRYEKIMHDRGLPLPYDPDTADPFSGDSASEEEELPPPVPEAPTPDYVPTGDWPESQTPVKMARRAESSTRVTLIPELPTIASVSSDSSLDESYATLFQSIEETEDSLTDTQSLQ